MKPLCIDLFCGLGGWADGFLAEGYDVVGFDIERHSYGWKPCLECGGTGNFYGNDEDGDFLPCDECYEKYGSERAGTVPDAYPGQLVLQDVLTLHGSQFKGAAVIVASPPCQAYSYRAMPWGALWREHNAMDDDGAPAGNYQGKDPIFNDLFRACFRIAREAGLPVIVENVKGAQRFVGRAAWNYGSFFLWGDIPALMPTARTLRKVPGFNFHQHEKNGKGGSFQSAAVKNAETKGGSWFNVAHGQRIPGNQAGAPQRGDGLKFGGGWWHDSTNNLIRKASSKSPARKAASAQIAKIPFPLAQHIARVFKPHRSAVA